MSELIIRNRQRTRALNIPLLRQIMRHLLEMELDARDYELGFYFVDAPQMARINQRFLEHEGSTDVITFDYGDAKFSAAPRGDIFICVTEAVKQAHQFRTTWQSEVVRYVVHSLLHLRGYDDLDASSRRLMKREEERLLCRVAKSFRIAEITGRRSRQSIANNQPS